MENDQAFLDFDLFKTPLSNVAQKIMSAMHSVHSVESENLRENEKKATDMVNKSSVRCSVLLEDEKNQSLGKKYLSSESQMSRTSVMLPPPSPSITLTDQLSPDQIQKSGRSFALSNCFIPWSHQKASVPQKVECKRKHVLSEKKGNITLKRKRATSTNLSEKASDHMALEDEEELDTYLNSEFSSTLKNLCDIRDLEDLEKSQLMEMLKQAVALVVTLMYNDGSTQLRTDQTPVSAVKAIIMLLQSRVEECHVSPNASASGGLTKEPISDDMCIYINVEHSSVWGQEKEIYAHFVRKLLFQTLRCKCPVICFNAKDFVRVVLQFLGKDNSWKHVADFAVLDPRIAAWLIDPSDAMPSFEDLVAKYFKKSITLKVDNTYANSSRNTVNWNVCVNLKILYRLTMDLCSKLKAYGLWKLFCTLELPLIPILAVMESHSIQVNKDEMERTSALLGSRLKELEQEAHFVAGEKFLVTSNNQLRKLNVLQDLHPLPKIILEYRQVHKIKSTFVDGLLACMKEGVISSTWNQTGTVTGRLSSKHPNIQGISKHPIQIAKPRSFKGKDDETLTISPRSMFTSSKGHTFLAADFSQIELRILAHLSEDPELLKLFQESEGEDVFSTLTSQWKDIPVAFVQHVDREQTKKVVYSVVYGAGVMIGMPVSWSCWRSSLSPPPCPASPGEQFRTHFPRKERLATCLGVTVQEAAQFLESFLQKYKKIKDFAQATIAQCHQKGYVASILGRRRPLPSIRTQNQQLRAQAERQAVNFVVQGSAADLCKLAMIHIFTAMSSSPTLTARLVAQIHDELLFEVEDAQVPEFAALVRATMESLQHIQTPELRLQVPLRVSLSTGRAWGCLAPLQEALGPVPRPPPQPAESPSTSMTRSLGSTDQRPRCSMPSSHC